MRKILFTLLLLALGGMVWLTVSQRTRRLDWERQKAELHQQLMEAKSAQENAREKAREQADRLRKLEREKVEAIRLRGDIARLRQQSKEQEAELANRAARQRTNSAPTENAADKPMIESFRSVVQARLGWNQTLVTGGWKTKEGKHTFVFIDASKVRNEEPLQLDYRTKYLELPDELLAKHGLAGLVSDKNDGTAHSAITREQMRALFESLKDQPGVDLLSAPSVTIMDGRQAQIKAVDPIKTADGQEVESGWSMDITGKATEDREFIDLTVQAHLNLPRK